MRPRLWLGAAIVVMLSSTAYAHEFATGLVTLRELDSGRFSVASNPAALAVDLPEGCLAPATAVACQLRGRPLKISGVATDAMVRVYWRDAPTDVIVVTASNPVAHIPSRGENPSSLGYLVLGIEHIALALDHVLFVVALLFLVRDRRQLLLTITTFTAAHSVTLAAAVLGVLHVPSAPVEVVIALSIVFVAREILTERRSPVPAAMLFGLLHGLGFAGALTEVGLPASRLVEALLAFNIGVELGQFAVVATCLVIVAVGRRVVTPPRWAPAAVAYGIGAVATAWTFERLGVFL